MNKIIHIGVLGSAAIAKRSVIPAILELPEQFKLMAVASRVKLKAMEVASKYNCDAIQGYDDLLKREDIDAVYIPLPSGVHHEWVNKALLAGKHVYAEKSIGLNLAEITKMISNSKENNVALMEGFMFQYHSQHITVKKLLSEGEIGEMRSFSSSFCFPPLAKGNFRYDKNLGGGALYDAGAYPVRASFFILGDDLEVMGASIKNNKNGAILFGNAFLKTTNGIGSSISFGFDNYYQCYYQVLGSKGKITVNRAFTPDPDFSPTITVENEMGRKEITLESDNHFKKAFHEFHETCLNPKNRNKHYKEILQQSTALENISPI